MTLGKDDSVARAALQAALSRVRGAGPTDDEWGFPVLSYFGIDSLALVDMVCIVEDELKVELVDAVGDLDPEASLSEVLAWLQDRL